MSSIKAILTAGLLMTALLVLVPNAAADPPPCDNDRDDDGDGMIDGDDPDCAEGCPSEYPCTPAGHCRGKGPENGWIQDGFVTWLTEECGYDNCMDHGPAYHPVECALGQSGAMPDEVGTDDPPTCERPNDPFSEWRRSPTCPPIGGIDFWGACGFRLF